MKKRQRKNLGVPFGAPKFGDYKSEFDLKLDLDYLVEVQAKQFERRVVRGIQFIEPSRTIVPKFASNKTIKQRLANQDILLKAAIADTDMLYASGFITKAEREKHIAYLKNKVVVSKPKTEDLLWLRFVRERFFKSITERTRKEEVTINGVKKIINVPDVDIHRFDFESYFNSPDVWTIFMISPKAGRVLREWAINNPEDFDYYRSHDLLPSTWALSDETVIDFGVFNDRSIYTSNEQYLEVQEELSNWDFNVHEERPWARR